MYQPIQYIKYIHPIVQEVTEETYGFLIFQEQIALLAHKLGKNVLAANNVLYLEFNKYGLLKNKRLFDKNSINKIKFSKKITENDLSKTSFIEGLFSSLRAKMYGKK